SPPPLARQSVSLCAPDTTASASSSNTCMTFSAAIPLANHTEGVTFAILWPTTVDTGSAFGWNGDRIGGLVLNTAMRIAVIADIHGNLPALEAVLADIQCRGVDRTINLGDCVSGPLWPREVCDLVMALDDLTIRGN